VFITVSTLYRPVEQLLSRSIAEREAQGYQAGPALRVAATIQLALGAAFAIAALALREPIQDDLLSGNETLYWILVAAVLGYAASYFARGFLAGSRRFVLYATLILSESISRTLFAVALAIGITSGQSAIALGIVAAPCLSLLVVPAAFARRGRKAAADPAGGAGIGAPPSTGKPVRGRYGGNSGDRTRRQGAGEGPEFTFAHGGGFAAAVLVIMFSEQTFLNAGPLLVRASLDAAAAGFIFNVLMIARAPLQLFQAVSTSLLPHLTKLRATSQESGEEAFRLSVRVTIAAIAGFCAIVVAASLIAGPTLMQLAFGKKFDYPRADLVIVAVGMGLYLSAATLNQAALAQGQVRRAAICWIFCAAAFVGWNLVPILEEFRRVEVGFTAAAALLCALLYLVYRRPHAHLGDEIEPGSPQELEARLAAADEGS
jgi:O-antigen/teichoic acid export membrane protein